MIARVDELELSASETLRRIANDAARVGGSAIRLAVRLEQEPASPADADTAETIRRLLEELAHLAGVVESTLLADVHVECLTCDQARAPGRLQCVECAEEADRPSVRATQLVHIATEDGRAERDGLRVVYDRGAYDVYRTAGCLSMFGLCADDARDVLVRWSGVSA